MAVVLCFKHAKTSSVTQSLAYKLCVQVDIFSQESDFSKVWVNCFQTLWEYSARIESVPPDIESPKLKLSEYWLIPGTSVISHFFPALRRVGGRGSSLRIYTETYIHLNIIFARPAPGWTQHRPEQLGGGWGGEEMGTFLVKSQISQKYRPTPYGGILHVSRASHLT